MLLNVARSRIRPAFRTLHSHLELLQTHLPSRGTHSSSLRISNVPWGVTPERLKRRLPFRVLSLERDVDPHVFKAVLPDADALRAAMAANKAAALSVNGRSISMAPWWLPPSHQLCVYNIHPAATPAEVAAALGVESASVGSIRLWNNDYTALVTLPRTAAAEAVVARVTAAPPVLCGKALGVNFTRTRKPTRWLDVRPIPETATRETLAAVLGVAPEAVSAFQRKAFGFACVTLPSARDAEAVMALQEPEGFMLDGTPLILNFLPELPKPSRHLSFMGFRGERSALHWLLDTHKGFSRDRVHRHIGERKDGQKLDTFEVEFEDAACATESLEALFGTKNPRTGRPLKITYARGERSRRTTMPDATRLPVTRSNEDTKSTKDAAPRASSEDAPLLAMTDTNSSTLYIGNVPRDVKLEEMKGLLPFQVLSLKRYRGVQPTFKAVLPDAEALRAAIAANNAAALTVGGRTISMRPWWSSPPPSHQLYVCNIHPAATPAEVAAALGVERASVPGIWPQDNDHIASVTLPSTAAAETVVARVTAAPPVVCGKTLSVSFALPPRSTPWLVVRPIPETATRETLAAVLGVAPEAVGVFQRKEFGFARVTLPSARDAEAVMARKESEGFMLDGTPLLLKYWSQMLEPSRYLSFMGFRGDLSALHWLLDTHKGFSRDRVHRHIDERKDGEKVDTFHVEFEDVACATESLEALFGTNNPQTGRPLQIVYCGAYAHRTRETIAPDATDLAVTQSSTNQ